MKRKTAVTVSNVGEFSCLHVGLLHFRANQRMRAKIEDRFSQMAALSRNHRKLHSPDAVYVHVCTIFLTCF